MFSCCLQKQKAVCPLHFLTSPHFRSSICWENNLKDIVPPPPFKYGQSSHSLIVILVLNALTSLQAERVVLIICSFVCTVYHLHVFQFAFSLLFFSVYQLCIYLLKQLISVLCFFYAIFSIKTVLHVF